MTLALDGIPGKTGLSYMARFRRKVEPLVPGMLKIEISGFLGLTLSPSVGLDLVVSRRRE